MRAPARSAARRRPAGGRLRRIGGAAAVADAAARLAGPDRAGPRGPGRVIARRGRPDGFDAGYRGYRTGTLAVHPYDEGVLLGGIGALRDLPESVGAVVSLCWIGDDDVRTGIPARRGAVDRPRGQRREPTPGLRSVGGCARC